MTQNISLIGAKFKLKRSMLGNPVGVIGYVFNQYQDFDHEDQLGIQIIFPNGNYDGFSYDEQQNYLEYVGYNIEYASYIFKNVLRVRWDFDDGYWKWE